MDIGMILIWGLVVLFIARFFIINVKRLRGYNIFKPSRLLNWTVSLLLLYLSVRNIIDISIKGNSRFQLYFEVVVYGITVYKLIKSSLYIQEVTIENIHKPQLESILEDTFSKWNLPLIKEKSEENITTYSFHDPYIQSKITINSSAFSTRQHLLSISCRNDILNLEDILTDLEDMIPPIPKKTVIIKLLFKMSLVAYIAWKIYQLFN